MSDGLQVTKRTQTNLCLFGNNVISLVSCGIVHVGDLRGPKPGIRKEAVSGGYGCNVLAWRFSPTLQFEVTIPRQEKAVEKFPVW